MAPETEPQKALKISKRQKWRPESGRERTLSKRDRKQQQARFGSRKAVNKLVECWDVEHLHHEKPSVDEHRYATTTHKLAFEDMHYTKVSYPVNKCIVAMSYLGSREILYPSTAKGRIRLREIHPLLRSRQPAQTPRDAVRQPMSGPTAQEEFVSKRAFRTIWIILQ